MSTAAPQHRSTKFTGRTREQRMAALVRANDVRTARARVKQQLRTGTLRIADVLTDPPACVRTARVHDLLLAVPGLGEVKAGRLLRTYNVGTSKTVAGLSRRQRVALAAHFTG